MLSRRGPLHRHSAAVLIHDEKMTEMDHVQYWLQIGW